jgi:hypothetical protein
MATADQAKHFATLYLEDLVDLIKECVDPHFGFSRYAEKLGRSANSFDPMYDSLLLKSSYIDDLLIELLAEKLNRFQPQLIAITIPFPGNVYSAFRAGQWFKSQYPRIPVAIGGGWVNTELRSLSDPRVFDFFDFITLDDGELPLECLIQYCQQPIRDLATASFKRTFIRAGNQVKYLNTSPRKDYPQAETGTPDYSDLLLDRYVSVIEIVNPMHRLWTDGRWNKLTMAHGCYWGKCTFCDISLDYIKVYEPLAANLLCDRIETLVKQTGTTGFHFVDEAAPPARMKALALEIIRRKLSISWWTNIRFEKNFTPDLCRLLKASGCIAVSGGLEVASDRLLELIQKGVTVAQVAKVCKHFEEADILVHAYLMYGYPSQTVQETIDSLEVVRQLFAAKVLQSGHWHQFAMTVHSPVGLDPAKFKVQRKSMAVGAFANNDLEFEDPTGIDHDRFGFGLEKSILNYMHGIGLDYKLQEWFDFKVPRPHISPDFIQKILAKADPQVVPDHARWYWIGAAIDSRPIKEEGIEKEIIRVYGLKDSYTLILTKKQARWFIALVDMLKPEQGEGLSQKQIMELYESAGLLRFEAFWNGSIYPRLRKYGLIAV